MRSEEFLLSFREALAGEVSDTTIQENVLFYQQYIQKQMKQGYSEEEVLTSLGNPRLLAKTIIEREKFTVTENYEDKDSYRGRNTSHEEHTTAPTGKTFHIPGWLGGILCVLVMALFIGLAFCVISYLAPFLLVVAMGVCVYRLVKRYW